MALSANKVIETKVPPQREKLKVVDGAVTIYKGALLAYESGNIGYVQPGTDALTVEFAGIATENVTKAAADNASDGTFEVEVIPRGSGEWIKATFNSAITIANEGDGAYIVDDDTVDIAGDVTNTTGGFVGIIRKYIDTTHAWVQLTQHPIL